MSSFVPRDSFDRRLLLILVAIGNVLAIPMFVVSSADAVVTTNVVAGAFSAMLFVWLVSINFLGWPTLQAVRQR